MKQRTFDDERGHDVAAKPPPVTQLDLAKVGLVFVHLVGASALARHVHIWDTARYYVDATGDESPERAFVREAFQLRASDAAAKWFGSELAAQAYIVNALIEHVELAGPQPQ
jgi:hypothetical protein